MAAKSMRAVQYTSCGGGVASLKMVEIPVPSPKKGEVLVRVEAASMNPLDLKLEMGKLRPFAPQFPFTPLSDIAGEVVAVGPQVEQFAVGDKVASKIDLWRQGGLAEYAICPVSCMARRSEEVDAASAAGLPMAGLTALQALRYTGNSFDGTGTGRNILITGASGGVGTYLVQLAKLMNHHVTATCGTRNVDLIHSLGADEVLDYTTPEGQSLKSPSGKKYDYIINAAANTPKWSEFKELLADNGLLVEIAPKFDSYIAAVCTIFSKKKAVAIYVTLGSKDLELLLGLMKEGKLRTVVDSRHRFDRFADAWEKSLGGHATGKVIVDIP